MQDAKRQFILDAVTCKMLLLAASCLISNREMSYPDKGISWHLLPNNWAIRESTYRINIYDEEGHFLKHAYSRDEAAELVMAEYLDIYFHGENA